MIYAQLIPLVCLCIDMLINKLMIKFQNIKFLIIFSIIFILISLTIK